jgi:hypothetical protein
VSNYKNQNGLVNGLIPKGEPCPFLKECGLKNERCPTKAKPNNLYDYSCAAARAWSLIQECDNGSIRNIIGKPAKAK